MPKKPEFFWRPPDGARILGVTTFEDFVVVATETGVYTIQNGRLPIPPDTWKVHKITDGQRTLSVEHRLQELLAALPDRSRMDRKTVREVCLMLDDSGAWRVLAGGHPHVHIGEWGGDFAGDGQSAEEAIANCMRGIKSGIRY